MADSKSHLPNVIVHDLPVDRENALPIAHTDYAGRQSQASLFGDLQTAHRHDEINIIFTYDVSDYNTHTTTTGLGAVSSNDSQALVSTGGIGTATLESREHIAYQSGHDNYALFTAAFITPTTAGFQKIGPYTGTDGYWIGFINQQFGVGREKNGTETFTAQTAFNLDKLDGTGSSHFTIDTTKMNIFRVNYGYLGVMTVIFEIYCGKAIGWVPFHYIDVLNTQVANIIDSPYLPIRSEVKSTNATTTQIRSGSWSAGYTGTSRSPKSNRLFAIENEKTISAGVKTCIASLKPVTTFKTKANVISSIINQLSVATDGTKTVKINLLLNATIGGTPVYNTVDADSTVTFDIAGTTVTGGRLIGSWVLGKADSFNIDLLNTHLIFREGDVVTISAESTNSNLVDAAITWGEMF